MKVLIVWEEIPENTIFYVIEDPNKEVLKTIKEAAGKFINTTDENEEVNTLSSWLEDSVSMFTKHEVETPLEGPFDLVVLCGFIM
jgi:hypothetical protein